MDVQSVEALSFQSLGITAGGRERVESNVFDCALDVTTVISNETTGEVLVVPSDGSDSTLSRELDGDGLPTSVDPSVEGSFDDERDNSLVLGS